MDITIDGKPVRARRSDKTLIEVAERAKVTIPCACHRAGRRQGCCRACVVVVDGRRRYACTTAPADGMTVVVDRKDLHTLRRRRLADYSERIRSGRKSGCCGETKCC